MVYCPKCKAENHAAYVASGRCVWCGFKQTVGLKEVNGEIKKIRRTVRGKKKKV
jgi:Zn ribbon nucleic-acid-binding protein